MRAEGRRRRCGRGSRFGDDRAHSGDLQDPDAGTAAGHHDGVDQSQGADLLGQEGARGLIVGTQQVDEQDQPQPPRVRGEDVGLLRGDQPVQ